MPERVIALDPGERTGWASATLAENSITGIQHGVLPCKDMALELARQQGTSSEWHNGGATQRLPAFDVIVYETFRPRPQGGSMAWIQGDKLLTVELIGKLELIAELSDARLVAQEPSQKTISLVTMPGVLRHRLDSCAEQHDQDALMHLWMYAWENHVTNPAAITID